MVPEPAAAPTLPNISHVPAGRTRLVTLNGVAEVILPPEPAATFDDRNVSGATLLCGGRRASAINVSSTLTRLSTLAIRPDVFGVSNAIWLTSGSGTGGVLPPTAESMVRNHCNHARLIRPVCRLTSGAFGTGLVNPVIRQRTLRATRP